MDWLLVIVAAFTATTVIRKLPGIRGLVARGVKPVACDACMSCWSTLFWRLAALEGCSTWTIPVYFIWLRDTAALAGGTFMLLTLFRWAQVRVGLPPDFSDITEGSYTPPMEQ